jgi:hypothetical protein
MTILEELTQDDLPEGAEKALHLAATDAPAARKIGEALMEDRRRDLAESMAVGSVTEIEVLDHLKECEESFLKDVQEDIDEETLEHLPEWLLRMEAMDTAAEHMLEKIKERT